MIRAVKKTWVAEEDKALLRLIDIHGLTNWSLIAASMDNRTGKQCRERYFNHLQPNIKKGNWSDEEDQIIISMQAKIGNQWSAMTKYLPGRTDNAIKNRWHAIVKAQNQQDGINNAPMSLDKDNSISPAIFSYKPAPTNSINERITTNNSAYYGAHSVNYAPPPHAGSMRTYTPFELPQESDHDCSPFKPSQMPSQMNVPGFDTLTSRVADTTIPAAESQFGKGNNVNNVSLDFLSYFFEKELETKDGPGSDFFPNEPNTNANETREQNGVVVPSLNFGSLLGEKNTFEHDSGLIFDFSKVSLDFSLDDCGAIGEYDIALPSPISQPSHKNLTVSVANPDEFNAYLNVPLSLRPRTPRSPVLMNLKRSRF